MEITQLLERAVNDDRKALDEVFQRLHQDLKVIARSRLREMNQITLTPTGLVNELYLKFTKSQHLDLESRKHFFACAATAMRQIVVDAARAAAAGKRGGDAIQVTFTEPGVVDNDTQVMALDQAMEELDALDQDLRQLVELKFFAGLDMAEISALTERSVRSLHRDWQRARAFLHARLAA